MNDLANPLLHEAIFIAILAAAFAFFFFASSRLNLKRPGLMSVVNATFALACLGMSLYLGISVAQAYWQNIRTPAVYDGYWASLNAVERPPRAYFCAIFAYLALRALRLPALGAISTLALVLGLLALQ